MRHIERGVQRERSDECIDACRPNRNVYIRSARYALFSWLACDGPCVTVIEQSTNVILSKL